MADPKPGASPLFAQKGSAVPSPAVAYVSLHQMRGQTERREPVLDRRDASDTGAQAAFDGPVPVVMYQH